MSMILAGLVLLVAWPAYNLVLVVFSLRERAGTDRYRVETGHEPRIFWIVVPCLNEERVVERTVRAALALAGPAGTRTRVLVVDDASDDGTPRVLAGISHPDLVVLRRVLPDARRGKGEALNAAFRRIRGETLAAGQDPHLVVVGVIDGDGRGSVNMLTEVSRAMADPYVGAAQCRVRIHNRNRLLAAVQDLEFACIANASQAMRNTLSTVGLGGNGQYARLSSLMMLGDKPWSGCLVEDLELGLRLHLHGLTLRYLPRASVTQQGLVDLRRLLRQRTRWAQGNLQCVSYVPKLISSRKVSNHGVVDMVHYLLAPWFNAIGMLVLIGAGLFAGYRMLPGHGPAFWISSWQQLAQAFGLWLVAMVIPPLMWAVVHRIRLHDEKLSRMLLAGLVYPGFLLLGLIGTWRAIARQLTHRQTWAKTERLVEDAAAAVVRPAGAK
jgi:cellulose synthase/poly-beta-1,6-N-acetylglucosamine synthase-like glycosyltransferase